MTTSVDRAVKAQKVQLSNKTDMVIDDYLKFKPAEQAATFQQECPMNTPNAAKRYDSLLRRCSSKLPPLKHSESVESLDQTRSAVKGTD